AIPHLASTLQAQVREVLVERLKRLPATALRDRLHDEDEEMRQAAAVACTLKSDKVLVPDLIELVAGLDADVAAAAGKNLQRLTGQDFGPAAGANREDRTAAAAAWQAWWRTQPAE